MRTLADRAKKRLLAEGPQHENQKRADIWLQRELAAMTSGELLERISDALGEMYGVECSGSDNVALTPVITDDLLA